MTSPRSPFDALLGAVHADVRSEVGRRQDRALNQARGLVQGAEDHVEALEVAARDLGHVRGRAVDEACQRDADTEIQTVVDGAFERLRERFFNRVRGALDRLRDDDRYAEALRTWSRTTARRLEGPADVYCDPRDADAVYEAMLEAGVTDFQVHPDRDVGCGLVARDPDGRTVVDRRPAALLAEHADAVTELLRRQVPEAPSAGRPRDAQ